MGQRSREGAKGIGKEECPRDWPARRSLVKGEDEYQP